MAKGALLFTSPKAAKAHISANHQNSITVCGEWHPEGFLGQEDESQKSYVTELPLCRRCLKSFKK